MPRVAKRPLATEDLDDIWFYIAQDTPLPAPVCLQSCTVLFHRCLPVSAHSVQPKEDSLVTTNTALQIQEANGIYREASAEEIIHAAQNAPNRRFRKGAAKRSPSSTPLPFSVTNTDVLSVACRAAIDRSPRSFDACTREPADAEESRTPLYPWFL